MTKQEQLVVAARGWLGTPYQHHQSLKGVGADCVGLLMGVGREIGVIPADYQPPIYDSFGDTERLFEQMALFCDEIPLEDAGYGDIYILTVMGVPTHVAIKTDKGMIHAAGWIGLTTEHPLRPFENRSLYRAYRLKEVA